MKTYVKAVVNLIIAIVGVILLFTVLPRFLSFFMPFVVAWVIALIASPMVRFLEDRLKIRRKAGTVCVIITVIALIVLLGYSVGAFLVEQISGLVADLPGIWENIQLGIEEISRNLQDVFAILPGNVQENWAGFLEEVESWIADWMGNVGTPSMLWLGNMAKQVPNMFVSALMCLLGAYFFTAERRNMRNFMLDYMPAGVQKYWNMIQESFSRAVGGYFKAQFKIEFWIYLILVVGLVAMQVKYAPVVAILIAIVDIVPVFGAGTVLIPWFLFEFLERDLKRAVGLMIIWAVVHVVRQVIQPKIMGDTMGLPAIPTLFLLYIGYKTGSVLGMIIAVPVGIIVLNMYQAGVFDTVVNSVRILCTGLNDFRQLTREDLKKAYREEGAVKSSRRE